jgi:hypothetical protein
MSAGRGFSFPATSDVPRRSPARGDPFGRLPIAASSYLAVACPLAEQALPKPPSPAFTGGVFFSYGEGAGRILGRVVTRTVTRNAFRRDFHPLKSRKSLQSLVSPVGIEPTTP